MPRGFSIKPEAGDYLEVDRHTVKLCSEKGFMKESWGVTSGVPGSSPKDQHIKDYGPIPEGTYEVDPQEIETFEWYTPRDWLRFWGDWGKTRVRLEATPETKKEQLSRGIDRWGLYFHGGEIPGSGGCGDLGENEEDFFNTLEKYKKAGLKLEVDVFY